MLRPSDEERLSAYFDEELLGEERAEAERLLREDPAARQWLESLEDLHAELRSLPRLRLPGDFAESVLRRAERELLLEGVLKDLEGGDLEGGDLEGGGIASAAALQLGPSHNEPSRNGAAISLAVGPVGGAAKDPLGRGRTSGGMSASGPLTRTSGLRLDARPRARWHAPSWLAAAASLLLFAGVLALATGERNWARAPETGPSLAQSESAARDSQPSPSPPPTDGLAAFADAPAARLLREHEDVAGAPDDRALDKNPAENLAKNPAKNLESNLESYQAAEPKGALRAEGMHRIAGEAGEADGERDKRWRKKASDEDAKDNSFSYRRAERSNGAPQGAPGAPLGDALVGGGAGGSGGPGQPFGPGLAKQGPGFGGGANWQFFFSEDQASANGRSGGPTDGNPAPGNPANVIVLDVDGAPAEAFARIEEALLLKRQVVSATATDEGQRTAQAAQDAPVSTIRDKAATADQTANSLGLSDPVAARVYFVDLPPTELARTLRHVAGAATANTAASNADGVVTNLGTFAAPLKEGARFDLESAEKLKQTVREENREKNVPLPRGSARAPAGESLKLAAPADEHPKSAERGAGLSPAKSAAGKKAGRFAEQPAPPPETVAPETKAAAREATPSTVPTIIVVRVNQPTQPAAAAPPPPSK